MPGTKLGGLKAVATTKKRHGADFYKQIGAKGGRNGTTGGFAANRELASTAGRKGGLKSKRGKSVEQDVHVAVEPPKRTFLQRLFG